MADSIADVLKLVISDGKRFFSFVLLLVTILGLALLAAWLVPKILHLSTTSLTLSSKGRSIELKSSGLDKDHYYLVVSPQTTWQPTHIYIKKGDKMTIAADGRVNVDLHGLYNVVETRIGLENKVARTHPGLSKDLNHTPEEFFTEEDWQQLAPRHYWSDPEGDFVVGPTSFVGRQRFKLGPNLSYGALLGTILTREDVDSNGEPPNEQKSVFLVGRKWPRNDETVPATGWLWLAINDVVEPQDAFPNAKGVHVPDLFLLDNFGFYRVVVTLPR